jgi:hypothetical protein
MSFKGYLKADTEIKVPIGPVVAIGDGFTPVTNLDISTADEAEIMKHDAAAVLDISGYTWAAIGSADGYYNLTIAAGALDTEGRLTVLVNDDSLCLPVRSDFMVVNANVYDSMFAAATTDYLQVDTLQVEGADATDGINAACDTALTDYDAPTDTEMLAAHTTTDGLIAALNDIAVADITDVEVDNDGTAISLAGAIKVILAVLAGKSSGGGTATIVFRDVADAKDRISATVDANGNRTAVGTRDAS